MTLAPTPEFRVQLCGPMVLECDGERLEGRLPGRQGRLMFAFLALNRDRPVTRDELGETLWPQQPPSASEAGLNALISKIRKVVGADALDGRSSLRLRLGPGARIDVEAAESAVHRAESHVAFGRWNEAWGPALTAMFVAGRELLPGEDAPWIDERRRRLHEIRVRALEAYANASLGMGGPELLAATRASRELVRVAPLRETGYQLLMRALASEGNVAEALRVYTQLCDVLRDELGISPCASTQMVYERLLAS